MYNTATDGGTSAGYDEVNNGGPGTKCNFSAAQQSDAALRFVKLVAAAKVPSPAGAAAPVLIGPDTGYTNAQAWLEAYLPPVAGVLHAVTHHVYDGPGRSSYNSPSALDHYPSWYKNISQHAAPHAQIWAGEDGK